MTNNALKWTFPDHPIFLGVWLGAVTGALLTDVVMITFFSASVGAIIGAAAYRQALLKGTKL